MTSLMLEETRTAPDRVAAMLDRDTEAYAALAATLRATSRPSSSPSRRQLRHAALYLSSLIGIVAGRVTASLPPSLVTRYGAKLAFERAFVVSLSQSGASPISCARSRRHAPAGRSRQRSSIARNSPLGAGGGARAAAACRPGAQCRRHQERRSPRLPPAPDWSGSGARIEPLLAALPELPARLRAALACDWTPALPLLEHASRLYVVGRGPGLGIAEETALKLKETSGVLAEALSAAEIQHGPKAVIGPGFPVLAYGLADAGGEDARKFAVDLAEAGAQVMLASPSPVLGAGLHLPLPPPLHPLLDPIVALLAFYPLAEALARKRGRDPDRPPGLLKVTRTF